MTAKMYLAMMLLTAIGATAVIFAILYIRWKAYQDRQQAWEESERDNLVEFSPAAQRRWGRRTSDIPDVRTPRNTKY